jgi:hypothetical protein
MCGFLIVKDSLPADGIRCPTCACAEVIFGPRWAVAKSEIEAGTRCNICHRPSDILLLRGRQRSHAACWEYRICEVERAVKQEREFVHQHPEKRN